MMIARGIIMMFRAAFAVGCVVGAIMIFPTWYGICETVHDIIVEATWLVGGITPLVDLLLVVFPYLSVFLIGLAMYIGFGKLIDGVTGGSKDNLDGY